MRHLLLLQLALLSVQPGGNPLVWLVCLGYLGLTLLVRLTAREQPPSARAGVHWLPVIGVGGILSGADAAAKLHMGAAAVQVYSGLIYRGPALVKECLRACADA